MSINDYSCLIVRVDVILVLVRYIIILRLYATIMHLLRHGPTRTGFLTHVLDNCFRMRQRLLAHTCFKLHTAHQCPHVVINHQTRFPQIDMTTNKQLIVFWCIRSFRLVDIYTYSCQFRGISTMEGLCHQSRN